jgi:hypothetical protein
VTSPPRELVGGLVDYGVESQVNTRLAPEALNLELAVITQSSILPVWSWFVARMGRVCWSFAPSGSGKSDSSRLQGLLADTPPHVLLVEDIRLKTSSPVWRTPGLLVVVSLVPWRGGPPSSQWSWTEQSISHSEVGGVTNGVFKVYIARNKLTQSSVCFGRRPAAPAKLRHVLDPTVTGPRCALPRAMETPLGQTRDGLLHWTRRLGNISAPTVYSKTHWVKRPLSTKELVSVLDLPIDKALGVDDPLLFRGISCPGKIRSRVLEELREWIVPYLPKASHPLPSLFTVPTKRRKILPPAESDVDRDPPSERMVPTTAVDTVTTKAAKTDDACVPTFLWDDKCISGMDVGARSRKEVVGALDTLRDSFLLPFWKRKVGRDFRLWVTEMDKKGDWISESDRAKSLIAGGKALYYASQSSWWDWTGGSFPFFWRWSPEYFREIRDGMAPRFIHEPPACFDRQRPNRTPGVAELERKKVLKVIKRGYLVGTCLLLLRSLMHYFSVPKGIDVRMVYDGSKCQLNAATFAPWFAVPTSASLERTVLPHTAQADNDFADMFLNFQLHEEMQKYTGVDVSDLLLDPEARPFLEPFTTTKGAFFTWDRPAMGLTASPYQAVQTGTRGKRFALGDRHDKANPFRWDEVALNLPGTHDYEPTLPWISKVRLSDGCIASDLHTYIDDNRSTANSHAEAWGASSRIAKCCAWLGMQDAARKRRAPSRKPGAWAGTIIQTDGTTVEKRVSNERWAKTKDCVSWITRQLANKGTGDDLDSACPAGHLPHKRLESIRGFLVYVSRTYPEFVPHLKGLHLTLDSWRVNRATDGWKVGLARAKKPDGFEPDFDGEDEEDDYFDHPIDAAGVADLDGDELLGRNGESKAPKYVRAVPRLAFDVRALVAFTQSELPPPVPIRPTQSAAAYLFGDASGAGHGTSLLVTNDANLDLAHGTWGEEASKNRSSNFRELGNLVRRVEQLLKEGKLVRGTELFIFTDNFVTESVFYKGAATSPLLHSLVQRLRMLQLHGGLFIHVIWVAGTRMIEQGTDGLSRGDLNSGAMAGKEFLGYVPLDKGALELSPQLADWISDTLPGRHDWSVLSPEGWYSDGHGDGHFIWAPPPAVADAVLEQVCEAVLCRPWNAHVFVCPAHMTYRWRKQLRKVADVVVTIKVGGDLWPANLHEPLVLALICPLLAYSPWRVKRTPGLAGGQHILPRLWSQDWSIERDILRKLWDSEVPRDPDLLWGLAPRVLPKRPAG